VRLLRRRDFTYQSVALPVWIHCGISPHATVSHLRVHAAHGAVFQLRRDGTAAGSMRLTGRCMELLKLLPAARWLSTTQAHRRFFNQASMSAARRRLRQLARAGYVRKHQEDRMREALFTLDRGGKRALERKGIGEITLERRPPKQLEHLIGINDIRVAAELTGRISFFFAAWELPRIGWKYPIVPDAVFRLADRTFAAEFDRGVEGIRFFMRTKITVYRLDEFEHEMTIEDRSSLDSVRAKIEQIHNELLTGLMAGKTSR
jgi:hypothetical protein